MMLISSTVGNTQRQQRRQTTVRARISPSVPNANECENVQQNTKIDNDELEHQHTKKNVCITYQASTVAVHSEWV